MKISLMTFSMVGELFFKFQADKDFNKFAENYDKMLALVKECGYEYVDVSALEIAVFTPEGVKDRLDKYGLKVGSYIYMADLANPDKKAFEERVHAAVEAVDVSLMLGASVLMLAPNAHEGIENNSSQEIISSMAAHFIPVVASAKARGVCVGIEDTPDLRLHLCSIPDIREVLEKVPGLSMVYDSGNMIFAGEDPKVYYDTFADYIKYIHLKDMQKVASDEKNADKDIYGQGFKVAPTGTGIIDLDKVIKTIKDHEYEGFVMVEFAVDEDKDYRRSLLASKKYVEDRI